jgi:hypothetical protein
MTKELQQEGITQQLLDNLNMTNEYSPVLLNSDEAPTHLLKCSSGYWVKTVNGYLRDSLNKMVIIPEKEARIARARYLLVNKTQIEAERLEKAIQAEVDRMKQQVNDQLGQLLPAYKECLMYANKLDPDAWFGIIDNHRRLTYPKAYEEYKAKKINAATDDMLAAYNQLTDWKEKQDYDSLYMYLFQDGLPLLATMTKTDDGQIKENALFEYFKAGNLENAIKFLTASPSHLYTVAKFNLMKDQIL